ncbi:hypothetical protein B0H63DRAFT_526957 [Podospora didyma]|uniref:Uncharacterized protein n=1 Tax=Podospora didyma TaxID=330526 RepID=A0AAE0N159_9PEZI|nr:hypothetical protein B0H63DRAFT_529974 [Podospora didyma]KAK3372094.1 hypothetical protein B0H63DRAFT_526957 [Podospora didyma]
MQNGIREYGGQQPGAASLYLKPYMDATEALSAGFHFEHKPGSVFTLQDIINVVDEREFRDITYQSPRNKPGCPRRGILKLALAEVALRPRVLAVAILLRQLQALQAEVVATPPLKAAGLPLRLIIGLSLLAGGLVFLLPLLLPLAVLPLPAPVP